MVGSDRLILPIKPCHMVGTGENNSFDAVFSRCLVQMVSAEDVRLENWPERTFDRDAAKVDDGINPCNHGVDGLSVGQIRQDNLLTLSCNAYWNSIGEAQRGAVDFEPLAQSLAQAAGSAGQQQFLMNFFCHVYGPTAFKSMDFFKKFDKVDRNEWYVV